MSTQSAFHRGVHPLLSLLLSGKEETVLAMQPEPDLRERIEELAGKSTEGTLTADEREEYEGYARANKFVGTLRREARKPRSEKAS